MPDGGNVRIHLAFVSALRALYGRLLFSHTSVSLVRFRRPIQNLVMDVEVKT